MAKKAAGKKAGAKRGRPPKVAEERLDYPVPVNFSGDQIKVIDQAAEITGRKRAELLRDAALEEAKRIVEESKRKPE